jgi:tryptophan halogenase
MADSKKAAAYAASVDKKAKATVAAVEERLRLIVEAGSGRHVGANDEELWFEPDATKGLQVRLGDARRAQCYDRSANFTISYTGTLSDDSTASAFRELVNRIKAIDSGLIEEAASAFGPASRAIVHRFTKRPAVDPGAGSGSVRSVIVVGGGTAGYFTALALKRQFPNLDITLIESSKIPVIGVGEATTTLMPPFLHKQLGIDVAELYRAVRPTWKLGIKFEWGLPGDYYFAYPFGATNPIEAYAHDGHIGNQSVGSLMIAADRAPIAIHSDGEVVSLLPQMKFAYHLDNQTFIAFLVKVAQGAGIRHLDAEIKDVIISPDGENVERLIVDDGRELQGDLYIDASGFRALLIEKTLGSSFVSFASSLFCDSAIVGTVPQARTIQPYTTAETMDAGWCWRIPMEDEDHRGYVYSSAHLTQEQARAEMQRKNPGLGDIWTVRFRSGRHEDFWKGNTVAIGNAYGFVEPLESTALHMVIIEIAYLLGGIKAAHDGVPDRAFANKSVAAHWDYLRWFLAVHYKYNHKIENDFWRACRESVDVSGLQPLLDRFRTLGPWEMEGSLRYQTGDPGFSYEGLMVMLLGQRVPCPLARKTSLTKAQWEAHVAESQTLVDRALTQRQALELLHHRQELLQELVTAGDSWINRGAELIAPVIPGTQIVHPASDSPEPEPHTRW